MHEYLGMDIDWATEPGTMIVSMIKYLYKVIEEFPEVIKATRSSPAGDHLFKVQEDADRKVLPEEQARQFHCTVAQLLLVCKRARPDIEPLVSFLMTRVKEPHKDDWIKLNHGLGYFKGTLYLKRHMRADSLNLIRLWVDASY